MTKNYNCRVEWIRDDTPTVYTLALRVLDGGLALKPGQFVMIFSGDGKSKKAYSASSFKENIMEFCIKIVPGGFMSNYLYHLKKGDKIQISGPYGMFILKEPVTRDAIFLATGTGISALRPMIYRFLEIEKEFSATLFLGVKEVNEIIYKGEFEGLEKKYKNFKFVPVVSREKWDGEMGHVQDVVKKYMDDTNKDAYICGVAAMVEEAKEKMLEYGFNEEDVHLERYV